MLGNIKFLRIINLIYFAIIKINTIFTNQPKHYD